MKKLVGSLGVLFVIALILFFVLPGSQGKKQNPIAAQEIALAEQEPPSTLSQDPEKPTNATAKSSNKTAEGVVVFGTVSLATDGSPVVGATVSIMDRDIFQGFLPETVLSDRDGRFEIGNVNLQHFSIYAQKDQLLSFEKKQDVRTVDVDEQDTAIGPIHLKLFPNRLLAIKVISALDDKVIPGATASTLLKPQMLFEDEKNGRINVSLTGEKWSLQVTAPGYEMKLISLDFSQGFEEQIEVKLSPGGRLFGMVSDIEGNPIADAWVRADFGGMSSVSKTQGDGLYELNHLPFQKEMRLIATKKDVGSFFQFVTLAEDGDEKKNIVLKRREKLLGKTKVMEIEGRVVDTADQPVAGALIEFAPFGEKMFHEKETTNQEGFFKIKALQIGFSRNQLSVSKTGYAHQIVSLQLHVAEPVPLKIVLEKGNFLEGTVLNKEGDPVSAAQMMVKNPGVRFGQAFIEVKTDQDGYFLLQDLPAEINLEIKADGFSPFKLEKPELNRKDVRLVLEKLGKLRGTVVYKASGKPVTAYKIFLQKKNTGEIEINTPEDKLLSEGFEIQARDGGFEFEELQIQRNYLVSVRAGKHGLEKPYEAVVKPLDEETPLLLEVVPFGKKVEGIVVNSRGRGLSGVTLTLTGAPSDTKQPYMSGEPVSTFKEVVQTNSAGRFVFEAVPDNTELTLKGQKLGFAESTLLNYEINHSSSDKALSMTLYEEGKLTVIVKKKPLPLMTFLSLNKAGESVARVRLTHDDEETVFPGLQPGNYMIFLNGQDGVAGGDRSLSLHEKLELEEGEHREIVLGDDGQRKLSGIALSGGLPAANRQLMLSKMPTTGLERPYLNAIKKATTNQDGYFVFEELMADRYLVSLLPRQPRWDSRFASSFMVNPKNGVPVTIADEDVEETLKFPRRSRVFGRVSNGQGIANLLLANHPTNTERHAFTTPLDQGDGFQFLDVKPGVYSLHVLEGQPPKSRLVVRDIAIPEDGSDVDLGEVNANPEGSVRFTIQSIQMPEGLTSFTFKILGDGASAEGLPVEGDVYDWRNLANSFVVNGLATGSYQFLLVDYSRGFVCEPKAPKFEIQDGLETKVFINIVPVTYLAVKIPREQRVVSATILHKETNQEIEFAMAGGLNLAAMMAQTDVLAVISPFELVAAGLTPGPWSLKVTLQNGITVNEELFLELGKPLQTQLGSLKRKTWKKIVNPSSIGVQVASGTSKERPEKEK